MVSRRPPSVLYMPEPPTIRALPETRPETPETPLMLAVYVYSMRRLARDVSPSGEFTTWGRSTLAAYLTGVLVELCPRVTHVCIDTGTALEETVELGTFITALDAVEEGRLYER